MKAYNLGDNYQQKSDLTFEPHFIIYLKTVFYEVNLASHHSHLEVLLLSKFWSEREDFNFC